MFVRIANHDGTPVRDYIRNGSAEAHLKILEYLTKNNPIYRNVNVGTV